MRIIAPTKTKIRLFLFLALITIFSVLIAGTGIVIRRAAIDAASEKKIFQTVIVDAGHGGPDGGTSAADGTLEKDINLQIATKLNEMLKAMGIETVMIRDTDVSIHNDSADTIRQKKISDLKNRLNIINNAENAIFVSIHQNHFSDSKYSGTQVFYSKNNPLSDSLADSIRHSVISYLQTDNTREIKQSGTEIYLLHHAQIPAVMVECGFLSNINETENLKNEEYQRKIAFLIAVGIVDFFNKTEEH